MESSQAPRHIHISHSTSIARRWNVIRRLADVRYSWSIESQGAGECKRTQHAAPALQRRGSEARALQRVGTGCQWPGKCSNARTKAGLRLGEEA